MEQSGGSLAEPEIGLRVDPSLRIYARLLLHIARLPRFASTDTVPEALTQAGMAKALGTSQAVVSYALKHLVDGGALIVERRRVRNGLRRVLVYQLAAHGEELVRHIRGGMGVQP
jgi:DNA-binding MarR family transcriptional regulator